jgi:tetratricopeptide (TPR) repeat protein
MNRSSLTINPFIGLAGLLILFSFMSMAQSTRGNRADTIFSLMSKGYEAVPRDASEAIEIFNRVIVLDSTNVAARKQLGFLHEQVGNKEKALRQFIAVNRLAPSDTTALQIAYLLHSLRRSSEAYGYFLRLRNSHDHEIAEKASIACLVIDQERGTSTAPLWLRSYSGSYYESRFENTILNASLTLGYSLTSSVSLVGSVLVTRDTRSTGGVLPEIFSDNVAVLGTGIRAVPFKGLTFDAQTGIAIDLIDRPSSRVIRWDVRTILSYGTGIYPEVGAPPRARSTFKPFLDFYASAGYYSRYANGISYANGRAGSRIAEWMFSALDLYVRGNLVADVEREFYNNLAEGGIGLRFIPYIPWGVHVLAEYHRGTYWDKGTIPASTQAAYNTFRIFLIIDHTFGL